MSRGESEICDASRLDTVAQNHAVERFIQPLGAMLHERQVDLVCAFRVLKSEQ